MKAGGREVITTRTFNVSREKLFTAWTDPDHLKHWWGPKGFTNTFHVFDLKVGGKWILTMHGPDGNDYPNESRFIEIVPSERIVFDHISGHRYLATAKFTEADGRTRLTWSMVFESAEEFKEIGSFIAAANEENLDRLEAHLATMRRQK